MVIKRYTDQDTDKILEIYDHYHILGKHPFKNISELNEDYPETCVILGTFFKDQALKPSILKELSEDNQLVPLPPRSNYNDENDILILEDELQRIKLDGKINVPEMITGVVAAVLGELCGNQSLTNCILS